MSDDLPFPQVHDRTAPKKNVLLAQFYLKPVQNQTKTREEGRPIFEEIEYIRIMVPGDKSSVIDRPVRIGHTEKHDNYQFAPQYNMFKQGREQTPDGTPLAEWPMISRSQAKELEFFNVKTVEQLASMPDSSAQNFRGVHHLREQAKSYIQRAKEDAPSIQLQAEVTKREKEMQAMQAQMKEMADELRELKAAKPKRGRPPKTND